MQSADSRCFTFLGSQIFLENIYFSSHYSEFLSFLEFTIDFQNDVEFINGCIAGGKNYFHINSLGDMEPCVFIHYSNVNIHECSLLDALKSPLFMAYHNGQPFNQNMLRPCPMLENPEYLRKMVKQSGAESTDLQSPESVDHLCDKCKLYAENWEKTANELWYENERQTKS